MCTHNAPLAQFDKAAATFGLLRKLLAYACLRCSWLMPSPAARQFNLAMLISCQTGGCHPKPSKTDFDQNIVAVLISLLLQKGFIVPHRFQFDSRKRKKVSIMLHCHNNEKSNRTIPGMKLGSNRNETGQQPE